MSRRAARAIQPLRLSPEVRWLFADTVEKASTFATLPNWAKELIRFGERNIGEPQTSVDVPDRIFPEGLDLDFRPDFSDLSPKSRQTESPKRYRYWKKVDSDTDQVLVIFRHDEHTQAVEAYRSQVWVNAFDQWERIVTEPFYDEIPEAEALELLKLFDLLP